MAKVLRIKPPPQPCGKFGQKISCQEEVEGRGWRQRDEGGEIRMTDALMDSANPEHSFRKKKIEEMGKSIM